MLPLVWHSFGPGHVAGRGKPPLPELHKSKRHGQTIVTFCLAAILHNLHHRSSLLAMACDDDKRLLIQQCHGAELALEERRLCSTTLMCRIFSRGRRPKSSTFSARETEQFSHIEAVSGEERGRERGSEQRKDLPTPETHRL